MKKSKTAYKSISWLPVDSRILPQIFRFGHVNGVAKIFLGIEISLSILIVIGALSLIVLMALK